jgi:flagellar hook-associated protein 2
VATSDSLQTLAQKINAAGAGVTATVLPSGSQYVLNIASTQGTAISWSDPNAILQGLGVLTSTGVPAQQLQKAAPAQYTINGVAETSPTNTDATSIPGVTLSFLAPTGSTPATVTVGQDQNSVVAAFQKLASDYNALLTDLNKLAGKGGVLEGEAGVLAVGNALQQILTDVHPGLPAGYQALAQIGVTLSAPVGSPTQLSMQVAAATLQKALATNGAAVAQLMNGAGGIAQLLVQELNTLVGPSGSVGGAIRELQQQISALSNEINSPTSPINLRIAAQQQALQAEFERMLSALVLSQAQGRQIQGFLLAQYGAQALGGSGGGPGGL